MHICMYVCLKFILYQSTKGSCTLACLLVLSEFNKVLVTWLVPFPLLRKEKVESIYGFRSCFGNFSGLGIFQVKVLFFSHFIPSADKKRKLTYIQHT